MNDATIRPTPKPARFKRRELQDAYEYGFDEEYDDALVLMDRFAWELCELSDAGAWRRVDGGHA